MRRRALNALVLAVGLTWVLPGCGSDTPGGPADPDGAVDISITKDKGPPDVAADTEPGPDAGAPDVSCTPEITECGSLCGLVRDPCTGQEFECGACAAGQICDIVTHTCLVPKITCQDLGAECGQVKNSCGKRLDCGQCPAGKECDPDSNTCVACSQVTCADLGYNCGMAWLGCGPTTNMVDCGVCPPTDKCNTAYNFCEPACTPKPAKDICAAAKAAQGVECGFISDGCGGLVDCGGCPTGEQCGIFGVANRCEKIEVLDECKALGYECGQITSLCDGKKVSCGTCPKGLVCNSNKKCGPPCQPTTCADLAKQGKECGSFPDGCNGQLTCKCADKDAICQPNNTCCVNTAKCPAGKCDMQVTDTCTGQKIDCKCGSGEYCETTTKTCQSGKTCADYQAGGTFSKCNDNKYYDRGDGTKFACKCKSPAVCINDSATQEGTCCTNVNQCQPGKCGYTVKNSCTGATINCDCPGGQYCDNGTCKALDTCSTFGANGQVGDPCSNGPNPNWPSGNGGFLTCPCGSGRECLQKGPPPTPPPVTGGTEGICVQMNTCGTYNATGKLNEICSNGPSPAFPRGDGTDLKCSCKGGRVCAKNGSLVSGGTTGTCIYKNTCSTYSATGKAGDPCSNDKSTAFPDGVGGTLKCSCGAGLVCADGSNNIVSGNTTGTCKFKKTCADYNADGKVGSPCNDNNFFDDGFGGTFKCTCTTTGGFSNNTCAGDSATKAGTCQCTARACTCDITGQSDGCGGTLSCACSGATPVCNTSQQKCCPKYTCSALPPGFAAGTCGKVPDPCMGGTFNCGCSTSGGMTNNTCVLQSGKQYGSCQCTPSTCAQLGTGTWPDGCGGTITCSG